MREVRWERMFRDELETALAQCPVVYFPYGLCEPHGSHCAVGLDILKAHAICCRTAQAHGGLVAPADAWHVHECRSYAAWFGLVVGEARSWCTAVPAWHHFKSVAYHIRAAHENGFQAALFLTGHYGPNWKDLKTILEIYQPHVAPRLYGLPDFEANVPGFDPSQPFDVQNPEGRWWGQSGDHAGRVETSLLWALLPEGVDLSRLPKEFPKTPEERFALGPDAAQADRRTGERMVADEVRWLGAKAAALLAEYRKLSPARAPLTFEDVDRIWDAEVRPRIAEFESCQPLFGQNPPPAEGSRWYPHCHIPIRS